MLLMPFQILGAFLRAILCVALLAGGVYLLKHWYDNREIVIDRPAALVVREQDPADFNAAPKPADQRRVVGQTADGRAIVWWTFGWNRETAFLLGGLGLMLWSLGGSFFVPSVLRHPGPDEPAISRGTGEVRRIKRDDGTDHVDGSVDPLGT